MGLNCLVPALVKLLEEADHNIVLHPITSCGINLIWMGILSVKHSFTALLFPWSGCDSCFFPRERHFELGPWDLVKGMFVCANFPLSEVRMDVQSHSKVRISGLVLVNVDASFLVDSGAA